ncbi:hypothetical protein ACFY93_14850 [Streptomyces sp. NPDC008313]|uniref:hypothetical protein n=1 Tax=Streptomyces sp. NPDC008313 TaxID=3364826 RepID=UPI0036E7B6D4
MERHPEYSTGYLDPAYMTGKGRHRAPDDVFSHPLVPPDAAWDPAEELAYMLQDAMEQPPAFRVPQPRDVLGQRQSPPREAVGPYDDVPEEQADPWDGADEPRGVPERRSVPRAASPDRDEDPAEDPEPGTPLRNLHAITEELPPLREAARRHRKIRPRRRINVARTLSWVIAAGAAAIASAVSVFGGMVTYEPLRLAAVARAESGVIACWPLLVYGPWLVAALSVLRAALHQRRAVHSWALVLFFSSVTVLLCVIQAPLTVIDIAAAALPGLASLACFHQVVRQITLTRPPRRTNPRHRSVVPATAAAAVKGGL